MKSLNLSPIDPQNFGKNKAQFQREPSHSDYQRTNIASASKRLDMRKQSVNSNHNNKPFISLKRDRSAIDINKKLSIKDEPTTENKNAKKDDSQINAMKYQKPGYSSQEKEQGPGGTNSHSTADDINLISNESQSKYILRFKNDGSQSRKMFYNDKSKQLYQGQFTEGITIQDQSINAIKKQIPIFDKSQECKIKVNQILNNNNLSHNSNRYNNITINPDQIFIPPNPTNHKPIQQANKNPRAIPYLNDDTINYGNQSSNKPKINIPLFEDQATQKKSKFEERKSDSSFDEEEDMADAKDFEEFDRVERSRESQDSLKDRVQIIDQDNILRDVKTQPSYKPVNNAIVNYNQAANQLQNNNNYSFQKDDRNSLVNYDTILLTHITGRDNNSSPISEIREARKNKQDYNQVYQDNNQIMGRRKSPNNFTKFLPDTNSFIIAPVQDQTLEIVNTKTDDGYCDDQIFQYNDHYEDSNISINKTS